MVQTAKLTNSWSPDGAFIAASNAMNGPVFVSAVIEREGWGSDISFVGHANTIQVAVSDTSYNAMVLCRMIPTPGIQPTPILPSR